MRPWGSAALGAFALALAPAGTPPLQEARPATSVLEREPSVRFPVPARGLSLTWEDERGPTWDALLDAFADATGRLFLIEEGSCWIVGFRPEQQRGRQVQFVDELAGQRALDVPAGDVYFAFETLLRNKNCVLIDVASGAALALVSLDTQARNEVKRYAVFEPVESIESCRRHPAVLVSTYLPLPATDVGVVVQVLRSRLLRDANVEQVVPAGRGLHLMGLGPLVCDLVVFLREVDARNAAGDNVDQAALRALLDERFPKADANANQPGETK